MDVNAVPQFVGKEEVAAAFRADDEGNGHAGNLSSLA